VPEQEPSDFDSEVPLAVVLDDRLEVRFKLFKSLLITLICLMFYFVQSCIKVAATVLQLCCGHRVRPVVLVPSERPRLGRKQPPHRGQRLTVSHEQGCESRQRALLMVNTILTAISLRRCGTRSRRRRCCRWHPSSRAARAAPPQRTGPPRRRRWPPRWNACR